MRASRDKAAADREETKDGGARGRGGRGRGRGGRGAANTRRQDGLYAPLGLPIKHAAYDGLCYPMFCPEELVKNRELFTPRSDDVIVATYPRSGTTWTLEIVRNIHLVQNPGLGADHPLRSDSHGVSVPWINSSKQGGGLDEKESPRVMKSHNHYLHLNVPLDNQELRYF